MPAPREAVWVASVKWSAIGQAVVALGVIFAICYFARLVWITLLVSALIAFMLEPLVDVLSRHRIPQWLGSLFAVLLLLGAVYAIGYFSYSRAAAFADELPRYASRIRGTFARFEVKTRQLEQTGEKIIPKGDQNAVPVKVNQGSLFERAFGAASEAAMTLGFIPFLVYFMLTWHQQAWVKTVRLFPAENRDQVRDALGAISAMMRTFIAGNFIIGIILSIASMILFAIIRLHYFYFLGFISGFVSLVPYLGAILAIAVPVLAGLGALSTSDMLIIAVVVVALHLLGLNVLYPKIIGRRLELNPLVVMVGLLVWGWMWGAMGLILAIPITAAIKIVCDHVGGLQPIGEWMGD